MSDTTLLLKALHFAADKHRDQRRKNKDASPYINHPIHVAQILAETGGITDVEILAAAILHDTVEDTETSLDELSQLFGARVAHIVNEVTDDKTLPKAERKQAQVDHAKVITTEGALVKLADKTSNILDIAQDPPHDWDETRRREYLDWAAKVVGNCPQVNRGLKAYFDESLAQARSRLGL